MEVVMVLDGVPGKRGRAPALLRRASHPVELIVICSHTVSECYLVYRGVQFGRNRKVVVATCTAVMGGGDMIVITCTSKTRLRSRYAR